MTDPVFTAFADAGLWPGLGKTLAAQLAENGITAPNDVCRSKLAKLPGIGLVRAERLVEGFAGARRPLRGRRAARAGRAAGPAGRSGRSRRSGPKAAERLRPTRGGCSTCRRCRSADADRLADRRPAGADRQDTRRGGRWSRTSCAGGPRRAHGAARGGGRRAARGVSDGAAVDDAVESGRLEHERWSGRGRRWSPSRTATRLLSLTRYAMAEDAVAEGIARLVATAERIADPAAVARSQGLDEVQTGAVAQAMQPGVSLLTGGPGTGKSRTVAALVAAGAGPGTQVALAAPTGRAAKRLEELCDAPGDDAAPAARRRRA